MYTISFRRRYICVFVLYYGRYGTAVMTLSLIDPNFPKKLQVIFGAAGWIRFCQVSTGEEGLTFEVYAPGCIRLFSPYYVRRLSVYGIRV